MPLFEWNEEKRMNCLKHGIGFDEAMYVFDDPYALVEPETESKTVRVAGRRSAWQEALRSC